MRWIPGRLMICMTATSKIATSTRSVASWSVGGRLHVPAARKHLAFISTRSYGSSHHHVNTFQPRRRIRYHQLSSAALDPTTTTAAAILEKQLYEELKSLSEEIRKHDDLYYSGNPAISDEDYDALARREAEISDSFPHLLTRLQQESGLGDQATRLGRVGAKSNTRKKRSHLAPMLSLENVTTKDQVLTWLERFRKKLVDAGISKVTIITEPKIDGLSLSLRYERRDADSTFVLQWASTRGDGKKGQDVTEAVVTGMNIPKEIHWGKSSNMPMAIEIRGEVVLPNSAFRWLLVNSQTMNSTSFSNARNAASGILLRKSESVNKGEDNESKMLLSKLCFNAYDIVGMTQLDGEEPLEMRHRLEQAGFTVPHPFEVSQLTIDNTTKWTEHDIQPMLRFHESLGRHRNNDMDDSVDASNSTVPPLEWGDYDMDGAVHKVLDPVVRKILGASNRAPRWAVAHKFPATSAVTSLRDVLVQVGRTGSLTPVAVLEPVELGGAKIQRATLHNFFYMKQVLGGGSRIPSGCKVLVRRAGDVIPQVVQLQWKESLEDSSPASWISLEPPVKCPSCGSPAVVDIITRKNNGTLSTDSGDNETQSGQVWRCSGQALLCPPRAVLAMKHAYSRDALDIAGLSESRIEQLMEAGFLRFPSDLFTLNATQWEDIANMTGWGPKSTTNLKLLANRVARDGVSLSRFIYSLGIRSAGAHSSKLLATAYGSVQAFLSDLEEAANGKDGNESDLFATIANDSDTTKGIGPVLKNSMVSFARQPELLGAAKELSRAIRVLDDEDYNVGEHSTPTSPEPTSQPLYGMTVVFTGSIQEMSRNEAQKLAKLMGARSTPNTVSKSTSLVVAGDKGGKKLDAAIELGITVMPAADFCEMAKNHREKS